MMAMRPARHTPRAARRRRPRRLGWRPLCCLLLAGLGACIGRDPYREHAVPGGDAEHGETLVQAFGCTACHSIGGLGVEPGHVGPPLDEFVERQYIAGRLVNDWRNLVLWLREPDAVEPGTAMPDLGVTEAEARDIAAYLYTLGEATPPAPVDSFPAIY